MRDLVLLVPMLFAFAMSPAVAAGPCQCRDLYDVREQLARVTRSEAAWMQIFGWARGLRSVGKPTSNDAMNGKFAELMNTPPAAWEDVMNRQTEPKSLTKVAGLNESGEVVVDETFAQAHCDEVVEAERVHERMHKEFYLRPGNVLRAHSEERLLELRAESEVESYRAQKLYLQDLLNRLGGPCRMVLRISHRIQHDPNSPSSQMGMAQFDGSVQFDVPLEFFADNNFRGEATMERSLVVRHVTPRCTGTGKQTERWVIIATVDAKAGSMEIKPRWSARDKSASWSCGPNLRYVDLYGMPWSLTMPTKTGSEKTAEGQSLKYLESITVQVIQGLQ